jgi:hypothetical protein
MNVGSKIVCHPIADDKMDKQTVLGNEESNGHVIIRSSENEQLLYLDGACGHEPIFLGITKSRGTQSNKLPVESGDFLGGVQVYARKVPGDSLGYKHEQTPLVGAFQFKVAESYEKGKEVLSEFIIGLTDDTGMSVKLKVDHFGNLIIANNITLGDLTITSEEVSSSRVSQEIKKYIKVLHMDVEYALPLHEINE